MVFEKDETNLAAQYPRQVYDRTASTPTERALNEVVTQAWTLNEGFKQAFAGMDLNGNGKLERSEVDALSKDATQSRARPEFVQAVSRNFDAIAAAAGDPETISELDFAAAADIYQLKRQGELMGIPAQRYLLKSWGLLELSEGAFGVPERAFTQVMHRAHRDYNELLYADYLSSIFPALAGEKKGWQDLPIVGSMLPGAMLNFEEASVSAERANQLALERKYGDGKVSPAVSKERLPQLMDFIEKSRAIFGI